MSFNHEYYEIAHVNKYTEAAKLEQTNRHDDDYYAEKGGVKVDGLWLCSACASIVGELRKKPGWTNIKIGANRDTRHWNGMLSDVVVYREGEPYAYGRIGHGDVGVNCTDYKYYVLSRKTRKARTGYGRWQNYVKASVEIKNVLRMVSSAFVPYTPVEICGQTIDDFTKTVRQERNIARGKLSSAWRSIIDDTAGEELRQELMAMVKEGYQFRNHKITERIANYMEATAQKQAADSKRLDAYFVILTPNTTTMIQYDNMGDTSKPVNTTYINTHDIPFDLQMKMASLQVAAPMHYVEDLGMRVGDMTFWVQR
jgi:hypothetical protein